MFLSFFIIIVLVLVAAVPQALAQGRDKSISTPDLAGQAPRVPQTYTSEGFSIEFSVEPVSADKRERKELLAGTEATLRFKIVEATGKKAVSNLRPAAWIDRREGRTNSERQRMSGEGPTVSATEF